MLIEKRIHNFLSNIESDQFILNGPKSIVALIFNIHLKKTLKLNWNYEYLILIKAYSSNILDAGGKGPHSKLYRNLHRDASAAQLFYENGDYDFLQEYTPEILTSWLIQFEKSNIWFYSNFFLSTYTISKYLAKKNPIYNEVVLTILKKVISLKHKSGLFCLNDSGLLNSMAGTFHFIPILIDSNELEYNWNSLYENVKKLHFRNKLFSVPGGYSCIDYDASYLIYSSIKYSESAIFFDEGFKILSEVSDTIKKKQNVDGGFSEFLLDNTNPLLNLLNVYNQTDFKTTFWMTKKYVNVSLLNKKIYNNSNAGCYSFPNQSTIFSTWFRLLTYDLIKRLEGVSNLESNSLVGLNYIR